MFSFLLVSIVGTDNSLVLRVVLYVLQCKSLSKMSLVKYVRIGFNVQKVWFILPVRQCWKLIVQLCTSDYCIRLFPFILKA